MILKYTLHLFLCSVIPLLIWSCEKSTELSVHQLNGILKKFSPDDSILIGRINDIKWSEDRFYMIDDHSTIYSFDSSLRLLGYRKVEGTGPGEVGRSQEIQTYSRGIMLFDSMNMKFVSFNNSLEFIREFKANGLSPFPGFNFLIMDSGVYSAYNTTDALITRFNSESIEHNRADGVTTDKIGKDLSFYEQTPRSKTRDNLYGIYAYDKNILLVSRFQPLILMFGDEGGTYRLVKKYNFEDIDYLKDVIQSNEEYHKREENINSWKTLVTDAEIYKNKLILLLNIEETGYEYFSHILIIDIDNNNLIPRQIYQLDLEGENKPWIRMFTVTKEGNLLCVLAGETDFVSYDIMLNE